MYHTVFGIEDDEEYIAELKKKFPWDDKDIARLQRLHKKWEELKDAPANK